MRHGPPRECACVIIVLGGCSSLSRAPHLLTVSVGKGASFEKWQCFEKRWQADSASEEKNTTDLRGGY